MKALAISVLALALSGITAVAYRHPRAYNERLYRPIWFTVFGAQALYTAWMLGVLRGQQLLVRFVPPEKFGEAFGVIDAETPLFYSSLIFIGVATYMTALKYLRKMLDYQDDKETPKETPPVAPLNLTERVEALPAPSEPKQPKRKRRGG